MGLSERFSAIVAICSLTCWLALVSCSQERTARDTIYAKVDGPCRSELESIGEGVVWVCGNFNSSLISQLMGPQSSHYTVLVVDSLGGDTAEAIRLARYLRETDTDIYVNRVCLSACAQIVAMGARRLHFRSDSIFGMHDSQFATNLMIGGTDDVERLAEQSLEQHFYAEIGANPQILTVPVTNIFPECIANRDTYGRTGQLEVKSRYDYFMPDEATFLTMYRGNLKTPYPRLDRVEAGFLRSRLSSRTRVNFGQENKVSLAPLPDC